MRNPIFTGSGVALVTPFNKDTVDFPTLGKLIDFQLENGTDALIVCGTTGEGSTMTYRERIQTIEYCAERVDGRVPVIAGAGSNSTEIALDLSRDAERAGADGLLLVTPYYNKASQTGLLRHYLTLADSVDLPCILYNVPSRTGVTIAPETYAELAKHPNINGVKDASGNLGALQRTRNLCPEDFYIWSGNDDEVVPLCALGGVGVISVVANIMPSEMHTLARLCLDGDFVTAGKLQLYLKDFCDAMFCEVNPIPVKTAMSMLGWEVGELRLPLCEPGPEQLARIRQTLEQYALLEDLEDQEA
jgi:4-hydroxy-tetrahydrodipicolinate synthase